MKLTDLSRVNALVERRAQAMTLFNVVDMNPGHVRVTILGANYPYRTDNIACMVVIGLRAEIEEIDAELRALGITIPDGRSDG